MNFNNFFKEVNEIWWPDNPPKELPREVFSLFIAGFDADLTPKQFFKFMQVQGFVKAVSSASVSNKVKLDDGEKYLSCLNRGLKNTEAVTEIFDKEEVKDGIKHLFNT